MKNPVRVKLDNGGRATVTKDYADHFNLTVVDEPAVNVAGVALPDESPTSIRKTAAATKKRTGSTSAKRSSAAKAAKKTAAAAPATDSNTDTNKEQS